MMQFISKQFIKRVNKWSIYSNDCNTSTRGPQPIIVHLLACPIVSTIATWQDNSHYPLFMLRDNSHYPLYIRLTLSGENSSAKCCTWFQWRSTVCTLNEIAVPTLSLLTSYISLCPLAIGFGFLLLVLCFCCLNFNYVWIDVFIQAMCLIAVSLHLIRPLKWTVLCYLFI